MSEADAIDRVDEAVTVSSLEQDLRALGVQAGDTLLVHASLSALGWVCGGAPAVVDALQRVLTADGTLVMPTHSTQYSDPAEWEHPPVPDAWVSTIRACRPAFRPALTPSRGMGAVPECFRDYPDVTRSRHPECSFAAWGAAAETIVADHSFDYGLGEESPLGRVYDRDGRVLLLGVGHDRNTSLHLAEYRAAIPHASRRNVAPVLEGDDVVRVEYEDIETDSADFAALGADYEAEVGVIEGQVGGAVATLAEQRPLVDFAVDWLETNR